MNSDGISKWLRPNILRFDTFSKFDLKTRGFFQQMKCKGFVPKVQQLEQLKIELDENDEKEIKVNSKKKMIDNDRSKKPMKLGFDDSDEKEEEIIGGFGEKWKQKGKQFVPHMFANKNQDKSRERSPKKANASPENSINKMFAKAAQNNVKNAGQAKVQATLTIGGAVGVGKKKSMMELDDVEAEDKSNKRLKVSNGLDQFKYVP